MMVRMTLVPAESGGNPEPTQSHPVALSMQSVPGLGTIEDIRAELDTYSEKMFEMHAMEPDEAMQYCSAIGSRLSGLLVKLRRVEDRNPLMKNLRIREVEPLISECRQQYTIASRQLESRKFDWEIERGASG